MTIPQQLRRGLVAYWPLDESSGPATCALYDAGGPYDLSDNNTVTSGTGPSDNLPSARQFTAANSEYLSHADNTAFELGNKDFTIAGWVLFDDVDATYGVVNKYAGVGDQREYLVDMDSGNNRLRLIVSHDGGTTNRTFLNTATNTVTAATWLFWSVRGDAGWLFLGLDLVEASVARPSIFTGTASYELGTQQNGLTQLNGRLAQVGFWSDRVLSAAELRWLYNNGNGRDLLRGV